MIKFTYNYKYSKLINNKSFIKLIFSNKLKRWFSTLNENFQDFQLIYDKENLDENLIILAKSLKITNECRQVRKI